MFRPNRIGTPRILPVSQAFNNTVFAPNNGNLSQDPRGVVINASPQLDFGADSIRWLTAGVTIPTLERICIGQQFTVTEPLQGDTVGFELMGSAQLVVPNTAVVAPICFKVDAAAGAIWGAVTGISDGSTYLDNGRTHTPGLVHAYKESVIYRATPLAGTFFHGLQIYNPTGAGILLTAIDANFGIRQLNDQQTVGYRDTRR